MSNLQETYNWKLITHRETALELTRLQVQLECAYVANGCGNTPSVLEMYEANLNKVDSKKTAIP